LSKISTMTIRRQRGFNLLEIMITVAVLAIVVGVAVPSFTDTIARNQLTNSANSLVVSLGATRQVALARGLTTFMCHSNTADSNTPTCGGTGSGWDTGVLIYASAPARFNTALRDYVGSGTGADTLVNQERFAAADRIEVTPTNATSQVAFTAEGLLFGGNAVEFLVCDASRTGEIGKIIRVSAAGRVSSEDTTSGGTPSCT
jgi:type IV fimbrial biogenesis protein FimT